MFVRFNNIHLTMDILCVSNYGVWGLELDENVSFFGGDGLRSRSLDVPLCPVSEGGTRAGGSANICGL